MMTTTLLSHLRSTAVAAVCLSLAAASSIYVKAQQAPVAQPIIMADFNHDGIPDALIPSATSATATIAFGSVPYGTFSASTKAVVFPGTCTSIPQDGIVVADFNGDGLSDIVYGCDTFLAVILGKGDGTFGNPTVLATPSANSGILGNSRVLIPGDFDHDGKPDLVVLTTIADGPSMFQTIYFIAGFGNGTFDEGTYINLATGSHISPVGTDLNGDGYPELVMINAPVDGAPSLEVFGNNKNHTFGVATQDSYAASAAITLSTTAASSILTGNFFGPATTDIVVVGAGVNPNLLAFQNTSTGTTYSFNDPVTIPVAGLTGAQVGTFTGLGFADIAVSNGANISVLANDGTGNFAANYSTLTVPSTASLFAVADANGDGLTDVYTANLNAGALQLGVNVVTGSATATAQPIHLGVGTKTISAAWAGNVNFNGSNASGQEIVTGAPSVSVLTSSKNPSLAGEAVTFTATVAAATAGGTILPTGTIILSDGTNMLASGAIDATGTFSFTTTSLTQGTHAILATYSGDSYFAGTASPMLSQVVTGLTIASFTPNSVVLGASATTITLTGSGFASTSVVQVNGTAIPTTVVNATTLTAIVPPSYFAAVGTLQITVANPDVSLVSPALTLTVLPPSVSATVTAPPTTPPGSQTTVTVTLSQPYPVALVGTLTIGFTRVTTPQLTDPSLQFAEGGTTVSFSIPANSTTIPPIQLQAGTIAGTIIIPLTLTAGTVNVTPANLPPVTIVVPQAVPAVSGMTVSRSGNQLTVVLHGFSNTREVVNAKFHFTAASGATIGTPDLVLPAETIFNTDWFNTDPSDAYGSTFTYTQIFNTSDGAANIGSVDATLTNTIGASTTMTAK